MTLKKEKMRGSGSKRAASISPSRSKKTKKHNKDESDYSKTSTKSKTRSDIDSEEESERKTIPKEPMKVREKRIEKDRRRKAHLSHRDSSDNERSNHSSRSSSSSSSESDEEATVKGKGYWEGDTPAKVKKLKVKDDEVAVKGDRYWGGENEEDDLESTKFTNSQDPDFKVGSRYYDDKPDKDNPEVLEENKSEGDYLVGKRYYDDKPEPSDEKSEMKKENISEVSNSVPVRKSKLDDPLLSRTGGAYIPPAKLRLLQASITDKSSVSYQRIAWEALKKSIHGHINKVNTSNIGIISRLLMKENIIRGRGLLCRSLLQAQAASPTFTNVYACLVSVVNSKFPNIGELLMKRVILQFKRGFKRNDKALCIASCQFIAHLVNQQVAHEILALEMLTLLLESPTDDSVEVAVAFLKEVGQKLLELSPKGSNAIFDMLRNILHQGNLEKRVQYMIEVVFQVRKDGFRSFPSVDESLDLVEEEDRYTHILTLDEAIDPEDMLNVFKHDLEYELNEDKYKALKEEIIGGSSSEEESGEESGEESDEEGSEDEEEGEKKESNNMMIIDETETNLVALRRTIYLTIQSSLDFEECCHKLLKMDIKPGQEVELCHMLLDCCAEPRTYEKFFGLLAQRFCQINRIYIAPFEEMFAGSYATVHRLDTNKLRNVARFFGHLLFTDAISWQVLQTIRLNEEETTSSSRIFIKILFQELAEYMGLAVLNQRLKDPMLQTAMEGLFPRDNPKNTRFAINFFTSIGLGGLTDELREHLKTQPKPSAVAQLVDKLNISSDSSSSSDSSDDSSDESTSSSLSSSSSSDSEEENKSKKKNKQKEKENKRTDKNKKKHEPAGHNKKEALRNEKERDKNRDIERSSEKLLNKDLKRNDPENKIKWNVKQKEKDKEYRKRDGQRLKEREDEKNNKNNDRHGGNREVYRRDEYQSRNKEELYDRNNGRHNMNEKSKSNYGDRHEDERDGNRQKSKTTKSDPDKSREKHNKYEMDDKARGKNKGKEEERSKYKVMDSDKTDYKGIREKEKYNTGHEEQKHKVSLRKELTIDKEGHKKKHDADKEKYKFSHDNTRSIDSHKKSYDDEKGKNKSKQDDYRKKDKENRKKDDHKKESNKDSHSLKYKYKSDKGNRYEKEDEKYKSSKGIK